MDNKDKNTDKLKKDKMDLSPDSRFDNLYGIDLQQGLDPLNNRVKKGNTTSNASNNLTQATDLIPSTNGNLNLGSLQNKWKTLYINELVDGDGNIIKSFDFIVINTTNFNKILDQTDNTLQKALNTIDVNAVSITGDTIKGSILVNGNLSGSMDTMIYASTIALDPLLPNLHKTTTINTTGNATINATGAGIAGEHIWVSIINDSTSGKTITFGTNFKSSGTITGTASKTATIHFISDGINFYEVSRTLTL